MTGTLYVVATPIGNLEDITFRAVRTLKEVGLIAAEDTRHSRKLLAHYAISTPMVSYHEHNEEARAGQLLEKLKTGESIALISDAGTPCLADPGYRLISRCRMEQVTVVAVPGPSALVAALSISGLPTDSFRFVGFLPAKAHGRRRLLEQLKSESQTVACYETPHRLLAALGDIAEICGADRLLAIARELTKKHEELFYGPVTEALRHFERQPVKGELVLLLAPAAQQDPEKSVREALLSLRDETGMSWKEIIKQVAKEFSLPGSEVYRESLELRKK